MLFLIRMLVILILPSRSVCVYIMCRWLNTSGTHGHTQATAAIVPFVPAHSSNSIWNLFSFNRLCGAMFIANVFSDWCAVALGGQSSMAWAPHSGRMSKQFMSNVLLLRVYGGFWCISFEVILWLLFESFWEVGGSWGNGAWGGY